MTDRKDLLLNTSEDYRITPEEEVKLRKAAEVGGMYLAMTNSPGWKDLLEKYLNRQISQEKYLEAPTENLADIRAAQKSLFDLLQFINKRIDDGEKAFKTLKKSA